MHESSSFKPMSAERVFTDDEVNKMVPWLENHGVVIVKDESGNVERIIGRRHHSSDPEQRGAPVLDVPLVHYSQFDMVTGEDRGGCDEHSLDILHMQLNIAAEWAGLITRHRAL